MLNSLFKKHIWHGLLFLAVGLFVLGSHYPTGPVESQGGNDWQLPVSVALLGFGLLLLWRGDRFINRQNTVIEYYDAIVMAVGIALVVRTFLVEPFKIPSGSMIPSLLVGDYLFVNKYAYGYRIPFTERRLFMGEGPRRGDVVVFKYPLDPAKDYIKRVVGLPGDRIRYQDKRVFINGVAVDYQPEGGYTYLNEQEVNIQANRLTEKLDQHPHAILVQATPFPAQALEVMVPGGHYFVLGDNRDNSNDSRFWGFVPSYWLVGRATMLFWSWDHHRTGVRWERLGQSIL